MEGGPIELKFRKFQSEIVNHGCNRPEYLDRSGLAYKQIWYC